MSRARVWLAISGLLWSVHCGRSSPGDRPRPPRHAIGGAVSGLAGTGLVLHSSLGEDLPVAADGLFAFKNAAEEGTAYAITVKTQPSSPTQVCTVANGTGTMGDADVANVVVTCTTSSFWVGGTASGLAGTVVLQDDGGDDLTIAADGTFTFATKVASGAPYAVTVKAQPSFPSQRCAVAAGAGTVGGADVVDVAVRCSTNAYPIGGTVAGLVDSGLVLRSDVGSGEDLPVAPGATSFVFRNLALSGSRYTISVKTQPPTQGCAVLNGVGTVAGADVTDVAVSCASEVVQRWDAPTTWGALWPDSPTLVEHAHFDGTRIVEDKGVTWAAVNGTPPQSSLAAFPSGARWGAGPFEGLRYQATNGSDAALDQQLTGDMLVCAVVKPDYNPSVPTGDGWEDVILAKGIQGQAGWVLMQMHDMFCFHYQHTDGTYSRTSMAYTPTYFADRNTPRNGPLDPSYVVVCGGRSGDTIVAAANGYPDASAAFPAVFTGTLDAGTVPHPLTMGGYDDGDTHHVFGGRVFETAIWAEPATPANIQARMAAVLGLPPGGRYTRNREGPWALTGGLLDGGYHTAWRHGPRIDPRRGFLFGLQAWNRLSYPDPSLFNPLDMTIGQRNPVVAAGEDLSGEASSGVALWTAAGGASVNRDTALRPPGDSGQAWADHVVLPPGAGISRALGTFDAAGPVHGMLWVRAGTAGGILTVSTTHPDPAAGTSQAAIDLSTLSPGWNRIWVKGLTTDGTTAPATLLLRNGGTSAIDFYAWGIDLTQIGGGGELGAFDPGVAMYDWGAGDDLAMSGHGRYPVDVLELPTVPVSTATSGFCLSVDAQPPAGMAWNVPLANDRALLSWTGDGAPGGAAKLFMEGTASRGASTRRLCFAVQAVGSACADPSSWPTGSSHGITGCVSAGGNLRVYVDGALAAVAAGGPPPDLATGHVLVGNAATPADYTRSAPWHGYISKAVVCRDTGATPIGCL